MRSFSGSETLKSMLFYMEIPEENNFSSKIRKHEISKLMANIFKRQNRKILIWGDFGVGKSSLVRQLYFNIHSSTCFEDCKFVMLDVPAVVTKPKEKLHQVFSELCSCFENNQKLCLIIENFEDLLMGVETELKLEIRKLLKNPRITVIATADNVDEQIMKNNSVYNLFEKIHLKEPQIDDVYEMIKSQIFEIEKSHNVNISKKVAVWLIYVSTLFSDVSMPKRCIDLIDEVATYAELNSIKHVNKKIFFKCNELHFQKYLQLSLTQKRYIGIHELGHFFVHKMSQNLSLRPFLVSIVPINLCDGSTYLYELHNFVETIDEKYYISFIGSALGGKAAEDIFNVPVNSGSSQDLEEANEQASLYSSISGMNLLLKDKVVYEDEIDSVDEDCMNDIEDSKNYILEKARQYAEEIIHQNETYFDAIILELEKNYGILTSYEIESILKKLKSS